MLCGSTLHVVVASASASHCTLSVVSPGATDKRDVRFSPQLGDIRVFSVFSLMTFSNTRFQKVTQAKCELANRRTLLQYGVFACTMLTHYGLIGLKPKSCLTRFKIDFFFERCIRWIFEKFKRFMFYNYVCPQRTPLSIVSVSVLCADRLFFMKFWKLDFTLQKEIALKKDTWIFLISW
jgi:hypothetical protein